MEDPWADPRLGRGSRVVELVGAVDRQEIGPRTRDAHEDGHAVDDHAMVLVGEPGHDRLAAHVRAGPLGDGRDDLVDGRRHGVSGQWQAPDPRSSASFAVERNSQS